MKKIFLLAVATVVIYYGCSKKTEQPSSTQTSTQTSSQNIKSRTLKANAGLDTTICMPFARTARMFEVILDGRASHDDSGRIVSYSWSEIMGNSAPVLVSQEDSTEVLIIGGVHQFRLRVQDDNGQVDDDTVIINIISKFGAEYDGLSWDSTVGALKTISIKIDLAHNETWPDFNSAIVDKSDVSISDYDGKCNDISGWKSLPYVPYDSIQLTDKLIFYSLISGSIQNYYGILPPEIFAKTNSGIDFNQKVSLGFSITTPWDY